MSKNYKCIDAGRVGCPCPLADGGKCIGCSKLSGGDCQDCNWQGTCIYTLYKQNNQKVDLPAREEQVLKIIKKMQYHQSLTVFVLQADKGFCQRAMRPGAYVFVRGKGENIWGDVALTILKAEPDKGRIHLGVSNCGPKSKRLVNCLDELVVRGVYFNGLVGIENLDEESERTIVFAKGISLACLRNFLDGGYVWNRYLKNIKVYVDLEKIGLDFLKDYFGDLPVDVVELVEMEKCLSEYDIGGEGFDRGNVLALTSPYYARKVEELFDRKIIKPNSATLCCGEGLCGACSFDDEDGKTVHLCKARS